jgi:outer membrane lipase/esterase
MAFQWMRRVLLALAPMALLALAGCGSGTIESQFTPTRMVVFGDGMSDMGNTGVRFSVNDNATAMWARLVALDYGVALDKSASGGTDYATVNARVVLKPDPAGSTATPTIKEQIDAFLAANGSFTDKDLVVIQGGTGDIIAQVAAYKAGTITGDQLTQNVKQAGRDLAAQAKRTTAAGANHVLVLGVYDLGRSPWAVTTSQQTLLSAASTAFNDALLIDLVDEGQKMLYVDWALLFNLMVANPASYAFTDVVTPVCTSVDPGPGIGIGTGQVSSALCTTSTVVSGANYTTYLWADAVYPTPSGHSRIAEYTFSRVRARW